MPMLATTRSVTDRPTRCALWCSAPPVTSDGLWSRSLQRGFNVVAFARERSGIGGRQGQESVVADFPGAEVRFGDVTQPDSLLPRPLISPPMW